MTVESLLPGWLRLDPADRLFLLVIPAHPVIRQLAGALVRGLVFGIGTPEEVAAARRACRDLVNVMFHPTPPTEIPWQDGFFSCALALDWPAGYPVEAVALELKRVLAPAGRIWAPASIPLEQAGFTRVAVYGSIAEWVRQAAGPDLAGSTH